MTMGDILDCIPPRPSEEILGVLPGVGIKPMKMLVSVSVAASFVVLMGCAFCPCSIIVCWLVFVPAIGIAMAVIASMFGAVMTDLTPLVSFAVFLHNLL